MTKFIASCSFGKDSLAAIIASEEHGIHIDKAVYCKIMFDNEISAELPEHEAFVYDVAIPKLKKDYGIKTIVVQPEKSYCEFFYKKFTSGKRTGEIYGFPRRMGAWCNDRLKASVLRKYKHCNASDGVYIVGIAADENKRIPGAINRGEKLPLVEYGITEAQAFEICRAHGLLSPAYNKGRSRLGCWFCHNQRISELRRLRKEYPELWEKLMRLDKASPYKFTQRATVHDFEKRFAAEDKQMSFFDY